MKHLICLSIFAVFIILVQGSENNLGVSVKLVEKFENFVAENPNATLVSLQKSSGPLYSIRYTFGNLGGDRVIAQGSQFFNYPNPQNVQQQIWYPSSGGVGPYRVTSAIIDVEQTTTLGNAYIYSGGIGQYNIGIVILAQGTTIFNYNAYIYGY